MITKVGIPPALRVLPACIRLLSLSLGSMLPLAAFAELSDESLIGPGLRLRPAYYGSASQQTEFVPVLRYLGKPWFARSTQGVLEGGVRMELSPGLHAGAQMAYEPGRRTSESDFLKNHRISDVEAGASLGAQLEWDHQLGRMPITLLARARQHTDADRGAQVDLRLSAGIFHSGRVAAGVFAQTTWANTKSADSFYGLTAPQSAATGLPAFHAGSGWLYASGGVLWAVALSRDWSVVGSTELRHLQGGAARSPLVERRSNYSSSVGLAYQF